MQWWPGKLIIQNNLQDENQLDAQAMSKDLGDKLMLNQLSFCILDTDMKNTDMFNIKYIWAETALSKTETWYETKVDI